MVSWVKQDGSVINIPNAMYETAKFLHSHPMLVFTAVAIAEFAIKQMMEHILDECAKNAVSDSDTLRGYFRRTYMQYRAEMVEKFAIIRSDAKLRTRKRRRRGFSETIPTMYNVIWREGLSWIERWQARRLKTLRWKRS